MSRAKSNPSTATASTEATPAAACQDQWQRLDHGQRKELIVDQAIGLLHDQGVESVTMRRLATKLGVGTMTVYTYIDGQEHLRREIIRRGFRMLKSSCQAKIEANEEHNWPTSARNYIDFALAYPKLYQLMFASPIPDDDAGRQLLDEEFAPLIERVREQLGSASGDVSDRQVRAAATRYWIALHGLASLAIAERLPFLYGTLDEVLIDLLERVAPS